MTYKRGKGLLHKSLLAGLIGAVVLSVGPAVALAEPRELPDVEQSVITAGGWKLKISLTKLSVNPVPNMAATAFTKEGFISGTATATIESTHPNMDRNEIIDRSVIMWAQVGCQIDLSEGGSIGLNPQYTDSPLSNFNPLSPNPDPTNPSTSVALDPTIQLQGTSELTLRAGGMEQVKLADKLLQAGAAEMLSDAEAQRIRNNGIDASTQDMYVAKESCGGPVFVRVRARATMLTGESDDSVEVYSDIAQL